MIRSHRRPARYDGTRHRVAAWSRPVGLRVAGDRDLPELERLAELETRRLPAGPHLIAESGGGIRAALSLSTGELIADPFCRTAELAELLRCLSGGLRVAPRPEPAPVRARPRLVPA
jgi:hypothetical protein